MPPRLPLLSPDRRQLIAGTLALACTATAARADSGGGFVIDWQGGPETPNVARSLAAQIVIVRSLRIKPDAARFFADQVITVDREPDTHTRAGPRGVFFERRALPPENPVLLHELLHRYHLLRLPQGRQNPTVIDFFGRVRDSGRFPPTAYMFKNPLEFFAMTGSVVLWGKAARPPSTRANVADKAPALYQWLVGEFGLQV